MIRLSRRVLLAWTRFVCIFCFSRLNLVALNVHIIVYGLGHFNIWLVEWCNSMMPFNLSKFRTGSFNYDLFSFRFTTLTEIRQNYMLQNDIKFCQISVKFVFDFWSNLKWTCLILATLLLLDVQNKHRKTHPKLDKPTMIYARSYAQICDKFNRNAFQKWHQFQSFVVKLLFTVNQIRNEHA